MANDQNLVPQAHVLTVEESSKGGKASGLARRQKRTMREIAEAIGNMELKNARLLAMMHDAGFEGTPTMDDAAFFGVCVRAQKGDPQALKLLAEMRGQYSTRVEVEPVQPKPLIDLTEAIDAETEKK